MNIPFVNLKRMHKPIMNELNEAINKVIRNYNFINGEEIEIFEKNFSDFCGSLQTIGVSSGTDALFLSLRSLGIGFKDIVVSVPNTFIATTEAISMCGATPSFVDVDEQNSNMSPEKLQAYLSSLSKETLQDVKAIIFVALYGNPQGLDKIASIARDFRIPLIIDGTQAHGAKIGDKNLSDFADFVIYSFFPYKNLGAFGDAGAVSTNNESLADKIRMMRNHGRNKKYYHNFEAYNCRMDTLQAAVLNVKLNSLEEWNANRKKSAGLYESLLKDKVLFTPKQDNYYDSVFHLYVIRVSERQSLIEKLQEKGINFGIHYPIPLHLQPAYRYLSYEKGDFPVSETLAETILSLPIDGTITEEEIEFIADNIAG